jgi:asparagine synthase (glutamine-hydrolysing)
MSGICAVWQKENPGQVAETLASVSSGLSLAPSEHIERLADPLGAGVGVSARFSTQQIHQNPRILIACDADLYNENDLSEQLEKGGPIPGNNKTAALLAALYERFGCDFVEKLQGAFSLVLWDRRERRLVAAIDGFGMNRLVYYRDRKILLVASRIDALLSSGRVDTEINPRAIPNVLNFTANVAPETILARIERLVPGSMLIASLTQVRIEKYWDMRYGVGTDANEGRLSRQLESLVEKSVADHCKHDSFNGLGAFLSGGTDSSTVVGMMSRAGQGPVKSFSIGFQEQPFNELDYAKITANKFHSDHHTYLVGADDCFDALPDMVRYFDEPFGNSSAIPTYFCARLAAQNGVKTLLAGDGGDELFGGNERYATDKLFEAYQTVPAALRKKLIEPVLALLPFDNGLSRKARNYIRRSNIPSLQRYFSYHFVCAMSPGSIFEEDFLKTLGDYSVLEVPARHYAQAPARDHLDRLLYVDMKITLSDNDLPKVTCMSELAGIQARFPFLDRQLAEFSGRIPAGLKVKGLEKRYLFKQAFRNLLPVEVIKKKKHGFGIPVATWMKSDPRLREFSRDILLSARAFERGYFRREFIEDLFRKHDAEDSTYYGDTLWTFLALELWHRQVVDARLRMTA